MTQPATRRVVTEATLADPTTVPGALLAASALPKFLLGQTKGTAISPWTTPPKFGAELWTLANFRAGISNGNTTSLTPSLTANGSNQFKRTLVNLGNTLNQDRCFRVSLQVDSMPVNGWADLSLLICDGSGNTVSGTVQQAVMTNNSITGAGLAIPVEFDFKVGTWGSVGNAYLDVRLAVYNNSSSGTLAISNVSVQEVGNTQRPMKFGDANQNAGGAVPAVWVPLFDPVSGTWRMARTQFADDGALTNSLQLVDGFNTDRPWRTDPADPDFAGPYVGPDQNVPSPEVLLSTGQAMRSLRDKNNDQVMYVQKGDGTYELRCNTHGGETIRPAAGSLKFEYDARGDGTWATWDGSGKFLRDARRFRYTFNTQIQRSDASSPFANVDHVATFFPDGMMRMDRTTTLLAATRFGQHFEWLSSHNLSVPHIGRIGTGLLVHDEVDVFPKVATPAAPTVTGSTTGGSLPASTYVYAITAFATGGETNASPSTSVTNTGTTSSNAVSWSAVSGATGYRIYRGASATTLSQIGTVGPAVTSFTDDGSAATTGVVPPRVNRARQLDATTTAFDSATDDRATWAVWYDPILNLCFGNIYDREAIADRAGVASVKTRLERGNNIKKNYLNVEFVPDSGNPDTNNDIGTPSRSFPAGTVWAATHWAFTYVPSNSAEYHMEIAIRAANLSALKALYPAT